MAAKMFAPPAVHKKLQQEENVVLRPQTVHKAAELVSNFSGKKFKF
jgi:hypothetical protein